jgi:hypothetical protein
MHEGWHHSDYLILFDEPEVTEASDRYAISLWLPGFSVLGLRSWDHLIVKNLAGETFSVPTVPIDAQYLAPFSMPAADTVLRPDARFTGKIKWYAKPIVFGGAPDLADNLVWASHEEHGKLVEWWNDKYRSLKAKSSSA